MSSWKTVRVFISSTFRDMQAERDHLVRFVFPQLRQELLAHRIHLVDMDLRWGVTSDQDASEACREVVDECHPRFLCMLGGRYGSIPKGKQNSITADEIYYGVLDRKATARGFAHFYFREESSTAAMEETTTGEFREPDGSDSQKALTKLKQAIADAGLNSFTYPAQWDKQSRRLIGLAKFGQQVHDDLLRSMKNDPELRDRFTESTEKPDEFTEENSAMEAFIEERTQRFVLGSRKTVMDELIAHANSTGGNGYLCLVGAPGSGKSALLAHFYRTLIGLPQENAKSAKEQPSSASSEIFRGQSVLLIPHFVGASAGSNDVRRTLRRLCHELISGTGITAEIPEDPEKLRAAFPEILKQASEKKHVVILLDAVNQFDSTTLLAGLMWLPEELPETVRIILSVMSEVGGQESADSPQSSAVSPLVALRHRRIPPKEIGLAALTSEDSESIINEFLHRYRKTMTEGQRAALLAKTDAVTPLYLLSALEELRTLGTYEEITDRIAQLPSETQALFTWILKRLEDDDGFRDFSGQKIGSELVSKLASLMGVSRHGLSQQELVELLSPGDQQGNVAALIQLLRPYLMQRDELLDFYHGQFREAVTTFYLLSESQRLAAHDRLATYFRNQADPERKQSWKGGGPRPFSELPFHLIQSENWIALIGNADKPGVLTDLGFIEEKCTAGLAYGLVSDYNATLAVLPEFRKERERLRSRDEAMFHYNRALREYAVVRYGWLQAKERGETTPEPDYPLLPLELKTEEEAGIPEEHSECASRLRHFANFVSSHIGPLATSPDQTLPLAFNSAENTPVSTQAERILATLRMLWLHRSPRPPFPPYRPQCLRILEGHSGEVASVKISPDGKRAISGSWDNSLRIWDVGTGACLQILKGHTNGVWNVSISPDGRRVISAGRDNTLRVWDMETGICLRTLEGHTDGVECVSISPDGKLAVSASWDRTLRVWNLETGICLRTLQGHTDWVRSVSICPDGKNALSAANDNSLRVWDLETGTCLRVFKAIGVRSVSVSPDGRRAVSASWLLRLHIWDLETGVCLHTLKGHAHEVRCVSISPDGKRAVSASWDHTLRVWDMETGACLSALKGHTNGVWSVSISSDGRRAVSASLDMTLRVWDLHSKSDSSAFEDHTDKIADVRISADGKRAISASDDKTVRIWDIATGTCLNTLSGHTYKVKCVSINPNGQFAVSASDDKTLRVWDMETGICLHTLEGHTNGIKCLSISPNGRLTVSASDDETLRIWDMETGACLRTLEGHTGGIECVSISPNGRLAVSASWDRTLRVWDLETGICLHTLEGHAARVRSVSICSDGRLAVSASDDGTLRVWDIETSICLHILKDHKDKVTSVSMSADGKHAISASDDKTLRVWNLETGGGLHVFRGRMLRLCNTKTSECFCFAREGRNCALINVSVSPDGCRAVSGSWDAVRVWDIESGICLAIYNTDSAANSVAFSPSTGRIVCGTADGQMHFLTPVNFPPSGPAILTAANPQKARCPVCGQEFAPPPAVVAAIQDQLATPVQHSSLSTPRSALLSPCPHCAKPLQFNPFFSSAS